MKKIDEDKKLNIFIIAIVLIIVIMISGIVYGVHKQKNADKKENETPSVTASLSEKASVSDKNVNTDSTSDTNAFEKNTETLNSNQTSKGSDSANADADDENKKYQEECSRINKKYDDIIATNENVKNMLIKQSGDKINDAKEELYYKQNELDIMIASGASGSAVESRKQEINSLQKQIDDFQSDIDNADKNIAEAKSNKEKELAAAEQKHNRAR